MSRGFWFVAGAGAGVYAVLKSRRAAEVFTPEGLHDRLAGVGLGAHLFAEEVRAGMTEKEAELRDRLGWTLEGLPEIEPSSHSRGLEALAEARSTTNDLENTD